MSPYIAPGIFIDAATCLTPEQRHNLYFNLFKEVCFFYRENPEEVLESNKRRKREFVLIRQVSLVLFKYRVNGGSNREKAWFFNKDHATMNHSLKTIKNQLETDKYFKEETKFLLKDIVIK